MGDLRVVLVVPGMLNIGVSYRVVIVMEQNDMFELADADMTLLVNSNEVVYVTLNQTKGGY